jgi:hypothetical protein
MRGRMYVRAGVRLDSPYYLLDEHGYGKIFRQRQRFVPWPIH